MKILFGLMFLVFSIGLSGCGKSQEQLNRENSIQQSIKALEKIEAATQVGVNKTQYQSLLVDAKTAVNQSNNILPEGELKTELNAAMESFSDANKFGFDPKAFIIFSFADAEVKALNEKYRIDQSPDNILGQGSVENGIALKIIWTAASAHLKKAKDLATKQ